MLKLAGLLISSCLLFGCATSTKVSDGLATFNGKPLDTFIMKFGAPVNVYKLQAGGQVSKFYWGGGMVHSGEPSYNGKITKVMSEPNECVINVNSGLDGIILNSNFTGNCKVRTLNN